MEKALLVDPLSPRVIQSLAETYLNAGRPDDALKQAEWLLEIHPQMRAAAELKGLVSRRKRRLEKGGRNI